MDAAGNITDENTLKAIHQQLDSFILWTEMKHQMVD